MSAVQEIQGFTRTAFKMLCLPATLIAIFAGFLYFTDLMKTLDLLTLAGTVALVISIIGLAPIVFWACESFKKRKLKTTLSVQVRTGPQGAPNN